MSETASLTVKMGLDGKPLKEGLQNAKSSVKSFSDSFNRDLGESKGAVKDLAGTIEGFGDAFDGSIKGTIGGFKDLVGLMQVSPVYAFSGAVAGIFTVIAKGVENVTTDIGKRISELAEIEKKASADLSRALFTPEEKDLAQKNLSGVDTEKGAQDALGKQRQAIQDLLAERSAIIRISAMGFWGPTDEDKQRVEDINAKVSLQSKVYWQMDQMAKGIAQSEQRRKDALEKINDSEQEAFTKSWREKQKQFEKEREQREKASKAELEGAMEKEKVLADAKNQMYEFEKGKAASSRFSADQYAKVGGQIGATSNIRELRYAERMADNMEKQNEITAKMLDKLDDIDDKMQKAVSGDQ